MKLEEIAKMAIDEVAMELERMDAAREKQDVSQETNETKDGINLTNTPVFFLLRPLRRLIAAIAAAFVGSRFRMFL